MQIPKLSVRNRLPRAERQSRRRASLRTVAPLDNATMHNSLSSALIYLTKTKKAAAGWSLRAFSLHDCSAASRSRPGRIRHNFPVILHAIARRASADRVSNEGRRQMAVMVLHHARVFVTQVLRDNHQRHAIHDSERSPRMPEPMKADRGRNLRPRQRRRHAAGLL